MKGKYFKELKSKYTDLPKDKGATYHLSLVQARKKKTSITTFKMCKDH